jgi:hypothetical protein
MFGVAGSRQRINVGPAKPWPELGQDHRGCEQRILTGLRQSVEFRIEFIVVDNRPGHGELYL